MVEERTWEDKIKSICLQLTPPALLASFESWRYPEGSSDEHRKQAESRVEVVQHLVEESVPGLLSQLYNLLNERKSDAADVDIRLKACIVVACGVYVSPRRESDGSSASNVGREPWINATNKRQAVANLQHPLLSTGQTASHSLTTLDSSLVLYLLIHYLKPIFSSSPSRSINTTTGRAAQANVNLAKSAEAMSGNMLLDDEIMWKGGDVEKSAKMQLLESTMLFVVLSDEGITRKRHRALGCYNILYICCDSLTCCQEGSPDILREGWPLILPPLLAVLEDSSPLYRLIGSRILGITLLSPPSGKSVVGPLLLQTGIAAILRQRLESNLTFISTDLSAALLQSSAETLLLLSQATTMPMYPDAPAPRNAIHDNGKERFHQLSRIMDEGVIRVWAYAPITVAAMELESDISARKRSDTFESSDIINTSIDLLIHLTRKEALGVGVARYLDVILEFLTGQMIGLETRLDRHKADSHLHLALDREIISAKAIAALIIVCKQAPGVLTWSSRCINAAARCWALLQRHQESIQVVILFTHLRNIIRALVDAHPKAIHKQLQKLIALDKDTFDLLVKPIAM